VATSKVPDATAVTSDGAAEMLVARLQVRAPYARTLLVAAADGTRTDKAATGLASSLAGAGQAVGYIDLVAPAQDVAMVPPRPGAVRDAPLLSTELESVDRARRAIAPPEGYTVICGGSILDNPATLLVSGVADGTVLLARRGHSPRAALVMARREIEGAGGRLLGAILLR
jgi:hypothetical protein